MKGLSFSRYLLLVLLFWTFIAYSFAIDEVEECKANENTNNIDVQGKKCPKIELINSHSFFDNVVIRNSLPVNQTNRSNIEIYSYKMSNLKSNELFEVLTVQLMPKGRVQFSFFIGNQVYNTEHQLDLEGKMHGFEFLIPRTKLKEVKSSSTSKKSQYDSQIRKLPHFTFVSLTDDNKLLLQSYQLRIFCNTKACFGRPMKAIATDSYYSTELELYDQIFFIENVTDVELEGFKYATYYSKRFSTPLLIFEYASKLNILLQSSIFPLIPQPVKYFSVQKDYLVVQKEVQDGNIELYDLGSHNLTRMNQSYKKCPLYKEEVKNILFPIEKEMYSFFFVLSNKSITLFNFLSRQKGTRVKLCKPVWRVDLQHYINIIKIMYNIEEFDEQSMYNIFLYNEELIVQIGDFILKFDAGHNFWKNEVQFIGGVHYEGLKELKGYENYYLFITNSGDILMENFAKLKNSRSLANSMFDVSSLKYAFVAIGAVGMFFFKMNKNQRRGGRGQNRLSHRVKQMFPNNANIRRAR